MAKDTDTIRFAVGSREDVRSSVWRLWARGNDLYLAARSFAGTAKISFHQSGINRAAVHSTTPRPALAKWRRPPEIFPGWTVVFAILVPPPITLDPFAALAALDSIGSSRAVKIAAASRQSLPRSATSSPP